MREFFLTSSDTLCNGLTPGSQSNWFPVLMNINHTIFVKTSGVTTNATFRIEHCPDKDAAPNTDYTANARVDGLDITFVSDKTESYIGNYRTGYFRINFLSGTGTINAYYFGGR